MINRGPDDKGIYIAPHIGLGHRRLSIIDLSPAGHQPMSNEDETIWITYNGEIYNFLELREELIDKKHVFRSLSDTEVLIHGYEEWGIEVLLKKINGMFAFSIWDARKEELILSRDRLGVKPLFYMEINGKVFFSSDIKSIWLAYENNLTLDYNAIDHFLYGYCIPQEYSIFREVKKVLPAHYIRFNKSDTVTRNYWDITFSSKIVMSENEYLEELKNKLSLAIRRRMISDVPLGAFLSGGVDSSLVTALMAMMSGSPIKTFSMGVKQESFNELKYARMVSEKYSTEHYEFIVEPDAINVLPEIIWGYGEPFADSSQIPTYYVSKLAKKYVTVALTGDGGDESFGGYRNIECHYLGSRYRKYLPASVGNVLLPSLMDSLISLFGRRGILSKIRTVIEYGSGDFGDCFKSGGLFQFAHKERLYSPEFSQSLAGHNSTDIYQKYIAYADGINEIDKALYIDIKTRLPNDYLTKVDVATMMNSLEARSPFLDYELMEFAAGIPSSIKVKHGRPKYLLKKLASCFIPRDTIYRKKQGFSIPIGFWFKNNFESLFRETVLSDVARKRGYFEMKYVNSILEEHLTGSHDHTHRLWALLCLELWHLMFIDKRITTETELVN